MSDNLCEGLTVLPNRSQSDLNLVLQLGLYDVIHIQCESKKSPLRFCRNFSKTVANFSTKFYAHIMRSYLRQTTIFYSITCNFDEVMPY